MMIDLQPDVTLGTVIHLLVLCLTLIIIGWRVTKRLNRIEHKQDNLLVVIKPHKKSCRSKSIQR